MNGDSWTNVPQRADSRKTRNAILDVALGLLGERSNASLEEIAEAADVHRTTVFRHFPRRKNLIEAVTERAVERMDAAHRSAIAQGGTRVEVLRRILVESVPLGRQLIFFFEYWSTAPSVWDRFETTPSWIAVVRGAQDEGAIRQDFPLPWINRTIMFTVYAAVKAVADGELTADDAAALLIPTVFNALAPPTV